MSDFLIIFAQIAGYMALGGVVTFAALYLVGKNGGIIVPPELTPDEDRIVDEERLRELGVGTGGKVDAYQELLWESERRKREASFARTRRRVAEERARNAPKAGA